MAGRFTGKSHNIGHPGERWEFPHQQYNGDRDYGSGQHSGGHNSGYYGGYDNGYYGGYYGGGQHGGGGGPRCPCFTAGTLIETAQGLCAVDTLVPGDMVQTRDHGMQPLRWIGHNRLDATRLAQEPDLAPVRIAAGALGCDLPLRDLVVSPLHRILVRSDIAEAMTGHREVLVAAISLVGCAGITIASDAETAHYVHILFDQHEIVLSEGAETESFFIGPGNLENFPQIQEIRRLFPELFDADGLPLMDHARFPLRMPASNHLAQCQREAGIPLLA